jgi:hypothetical protein
MDCRCAHLFQTIHFFHPSRSQIRNQQSMTESSMQLNSAVIEHSNDINDDPTSTSHASQMQNA